MIPVRYILCSARTSKSATLRMTETRRTVDPLALPLERTQKNLELSKHPEVKLFCNSFTGADAWRYQSPKEIGGSDYWGKIAMFSGGGAVQNMDLTRRRTEAIIRVYYFDITRPALNQLRFRN